MFVYCVSVAVCVIVTELFCFLLSYLQILLFLICEKKSGSLSLTLSVSGWGGGTSFFSSACWGKVTDCAVAQPPSTYTCVCVCIYKCLWVRVCLVLSVSSRKTQKDRMFCVPRSDTQSIIKRKMYQAIMFCQAVSGPKTSSFNTLWWRKLGYACLRSKEFWQLGKQGLSLLNCCIQVQSVSPGVELASWAIMITLHW